MIGNAPLRAKISAGRTVWSATRRSPSVSCWSSLTSFCNYSEDNKSRYKLLDRPVRNTGACVIKCRQFNEKSSRTQELAIEPKYFAPPAALIDKDPKASTTSPFWSSSLASHRGRFLLFGGSRCKGFLISNKSSVNKSCLSVDTRECEYRRASSRSRTRWESSDIFSWSSWVDARTNLDWEIIRGYSAL